MMEILAVSEGCCGRTLEIFETHGYVEMQLVMAIPSSRLSSTSAQAILNRVWSRLADTGLKPVLDDVVDQGDMGLVNGVGAEPACIYRPADCRGEHALVSVHGIIPRQETELPREFVSESSPSGLAEKHP